jgi:hypothetical protein
MAKIVNRDLDASEQKSMLSGTIRSTVTGTSYTIAQVPFNAIVLGGFEASGGLSGTPTGHVVVNRFIAGAGETTILGLFQTHTPTAFGVSGLQGLSLIGASTVLLLAGDKLVYRAAGTNAALAETTVSVVVKALQDVRTVLGL